MATIRLKQNLQPGATMTVSSDEDAQAIVRAGLADLVDGQGASEQAQTGQATPSSPASPTGSQADRKQR